MQWQEETESLLQKKKLWIATKIYLISDEVLQVIS